MSAFKLSQLFAVFGGAATTQMAPTARPLLYVLTCQVDEGRCVLAYSRKKIDMDRLLATILDLPRCDLQVEPHRPLLHWLPEFEAGKVYAIVAGDDEPLNVRLLINRRGAPSLPDEFDVLPNPILANMYYYTGVGDLV